MIRGPAIFKQLLEDEWEPNVPGRQAIPDVVSKDGEEGSGVIIVKNYDEVRTKTNVFDAVHLFYPRGVGTSYPAQGFREEGVVDEFQIDIRISNRDIDDDAIREGVEDRMLGPVDVDGNPEELGGLAGEVKRILNGVIGGHGPYDEVTHEEVARDIQNTDARVSYSVEARVVARNVQNPL